MSTGPFFSPDNQTILFADFVPPAPLASQHSKAGSGPVTLTRQIRWCDVSSPNYQHSYLYTSQWPREEVSGKKGRYLWAAKGLSLSPDGKRLLLAGPPTKILDLRTGKTQDLDLGESAQLASARWLNDSEIIYFRSSGRPVYQDGHTMMPRYPVQVYRQGIDLPPDQAILVISSHVCTLDDSFYLSPRGRWLRLCDITKAAEVFILIGDQSTSRLRKDLSLCNAWGPWRPDDSVWAMRHADVGTDGRIVKWLSLERIAETPAGKIETPMSWQINTDVEWTAEGKYLLVNDKMHMILIEPESGEQVSLAPKLDRLLGKPKPGWERRIRVLPVPGWLLVIDCRIDWLGQTWFHWTAVDYEATRATPVPTPGDFTPDGRYLVTYPDGHGQFQVKPWSFEAPTSMPSK